VGYYRVSLDSGVIVELAASERAGMYRYTFGDEGGEASNVVVDVSHVLPSYRGFGWSQSYTMGGIEVFEDGHYELNGTYDGGWNIGE
jgi:putative alpha-1,2-mannosidase